VFRVGRLVLFVLVVLIKLGRHLTQLAEGRLVSTGCAATAALVWAPSRARGQSLAASELGPPVAEPDLHSGLAQVGQFAKIFTSLHTWVVAPLEFLFEEAQLLVREGGPIAAKLGHRVGAAHQAAGGRARRRGGARRTVGGARGGA